MDISRSKKFAESVLENDWYQTASKEDMREALLYLMGELLDEVACQAKMATAQCKRKLREEIIIK